MQQKLQNEPQAAAPSTPTSSARELPAAQDSQEIQDRSAADLRSVDKLLFRLKKQARLQKLSRIGAVLLGIPPVLIFLAWLLNTVYPSGWIWTRYLTYLTPFHSTSVSVTPPSDQFVNGVHMHTNAATITIYHTDLITPLLLTLGCIMLAALARRQRGKMARTLAQHDDTRVVGPLAQALYIPEKGVAEAASKALIGLLPRLQARDAGRLTGEQRECLHRALNGKNTHLSLAILKAYEQVGDSRDLAVVERLAADRKGRGKEKQVQEAAAACLPFLRQHIEQDRSRQTLLRAADSASEESSATLLRPGEGVAAVDPKQLLRANVSDEA